MHPSGADVTLCMKKVYIDNGPLCSLHLCRKISLFVCKQIELNNTVPHSRQYTYGIMIQ